MNLKKDLIEKELIKKEWLSNCRKPQLKKLEKS